MDINCKNTQDITYYRYIYPHSLSKYLLRTYDAANTARSKSTGTESLPG